MTIQPELCKNCGSTELIYGKLKGLADGMFEQGVQFCPKGLKSMTFSATGGFPVDAKACVCLHCGHIHGQCISQQAQKFIEAKCDAEEAKTPHSR